MYTVYKVTSPSDKVYIGITKNGLPRRKYIHELRAKNGSKLPFHLAISKYGDNLNWEIIYKGLTKDQAIKFEKSLISDYKNLKKSYNVCDGGEGTSGYKFTKEDRIKIRESMSKLDLTNSDEVRLRKSISKGGKKFRVIDTKTNNLVGIWQNLRQCERDLNIPKPHIWRCLKGLRKTTRNYKFEYIG